MTILYAMSFFGEDGFSSSFLGNYRDNEEEEEEGEKVSDHSSSSFSIGGGEFYARRGRGNSYKNLMRE
jgi:hypothetical protein